MAGGKTLVILGGLVAAAIAAGVWLVLDEPGSADPAPEPEDVAEKGPKPPSETNGSQARKPDRKKARISGTCTVFGTVKRRQGDAPSAGQVVQLAGGPGVEPYETTTGDDGTFRIEQIADGGPYEIRVESKGFATVRVPGIVLARGEERDAGTLYLDQAANVPVLVTSWSGVPVEGANVGAFVAPDWTRGAPDWNKLAAQAAAVPVAVATVTTDREGKATFAALAGGMWTFAAKKDGFATDGRANVRIEGGADVPVVRIYLPSGHALRGRVLDGEKKPIAGVLVMGGRGNIVNDVGSAALRARATSDPEGNYELAGLPAGDVQLQLAPPGTRPFVAATVRIPAVTRYDVYIRSGGAVAGTVVETTTGKPIEGVTVSANGNSRIATATTDGSGKYVIAAVPDGPIHGVSVSKEGWIQDRSDDPPMQAQIQVNPGDQIVRDFRMKRGARVTGIVRGPDGPLAGARVSVYTVTKDRGTTTSTSVVTDAKGKYAIEPVEAGRGMVAVNKAGFVQKGVPANPWNQLNQGNIPASAKVEIPPVGEITFDVVLDRGSRIEGKVEAAGSPVAGATVTAWSSMGQSTNTTAGADGTFVLEGLLPGGKVTVSAQREGFVAKRVDPVDVTDAGPVTGIVVTMVPQPVIRGKVTSAAGLPLKDVQVSVVPKSSGQPMGYDPSWNQSVAAGTPVAEDGSFETKFFQLEGTIAVRATSPDHAPGESAAVTLVEGKSEYTADVVIEAGYAIRGRVASKGAGVAGASVQLSPVRSGRNRGGNMMPSAIPMGGSGVGSNAGTVVAVTDAEGLFTIDHVGQGNYTVTANAEGYGAATANNVAVPASGDISIELEPSLEISGKVTFADGRPAAGAMISAQKDQGGQRNPYESWGWGGSQIVTGPDGSFRIRNLASGQYRLQVTAPWDGSVNFRSMQSDPVAAGTADFKMTVEGGGAISGRVLDPDRKPVGGVWVYSNPTKPEPGYGWRQTKSKNDGTFTLNSLGDGPYSLTAQPPTVGEASYFRPAMAQNVAPGTANFELVLEAGLEITGQVLDSSGKPVPEFQLYIQPKPDAQGNQPQMNWNMSQISTDADGRFRVRGLGPGKYTIMAQQWGGGRSESLLLTGGDDIAAGTADLVLNASSGAKVAGVVVDETGQPIRGAWVYAQPPNGMGRNAQTDKDGRFEIAALPPGTVTITAQTGGRPPATLQKVETGTTVLRVVITKGGAIAGKLTDSAGAAFGGQNLMLRQTDGGAHATWTQTGPDGRFNAESLPEGAYDIYLHRKKDAAGNEWEQVKIGAARTGETVELKAP